VNSKPIGIAFIISIALMTVGYGLTFNPTTVQIGIIMGVFGMAILVIAIQYTVLWLINLSDYLPLWILCATFDLIGFVYFIRFLIQNFDMQPV
jgi:hypothetical protein